MNWVLCINEVFDLDQPRTKVHLLLHRYYHIWKKFFFWFFSSCICLFKNKRKILQFRKYELDYERSNRPLMSHLKKHQMFGRPNFLSPRAYFPSRHQLHFYSIHSWHGNDSIKHRKIANVIFLFMHKLLWKTLSKLLFHWWIFKVHKKNMSLVVQKKKNNLKKGHAFLVDIEL